MNLGLSSHWKSTVLKKLVSNKSYLKIFKKDHMKRLMKNHPDLTNLRKELSNSRQAYSLFLHHVKIITQISVTRSKQARATTHLILEILLLSPV